MAMAIGPIGIPRPTLIAQGTVVSSLRAQEITSVLTALMIELPLSAVSHQHGQPLITHPVRAMTGTRPETREVGSQAVEIGTAHAATEVLVTDHLGRGPRVISPRPQVVVSETRARTQIAVGPIMAGRQTGPRFLGAINGHGPTAHRPP